MHMVTWTARPVRALRSIPTGGWLSSCSSRSIAQDCAAIFERLRQVQGGMYCANCGSESPYGKKFCGGGGFVLEVCNR